MKFDSAYYNGDFPKEYRLTELENLKENHWQDFENIRHHLYCPVCREAGVEAVCSETFHLRSKSADQNNSPHTLVCPHRYETVTSSQYTKYSENPQNAETIHRRLENLIRNAFFNEQLEHKDFLLSVSEDNNRKVQEYDEHRPNATRSIPRKMITERLYDEDYNCYKMFYGEILLEWQPDYGENGAKVALKKLNDDFICSLTMSRSFVKNEIDVNFLQNIQAKIAFNGMIKWQTYKNKKNEEKRTRTCHIGNFLYIFFSN
jgi:hypothetical protein